MFTLLIYFLSFIEILAGCLNLSEILLIAGDPLLLNPLLLDHEILISCLVPVMVYDNPETDKSRILCENKYKAGIYMWRHKESGKRYIGSAVNLTKRISNYHSSKYLARFKCMHINNAILHHGISAFSLTIYENIIISGLSKEQIKKFILELEQFYLDTINPEYNILKVAGSRLGSKHSDESIAKF